MDAWVRRPMTIGFPQVRARKRRRSSGRCHGSRFSTPMTPLRATAAMRDTSTGGRTGCTGYTETEAGSAEWCW